MLLNPPAGSALTAAEAADLVADAASPGSPLPEADEPFGSIPVIFPPISSSAVCISPRTSAKRPSRRINA
jgi:hypothetical protein